MTAENPTLCQEPVQPETTKEWRLDRLPEFLARLLKPEEPVSQEITPDAARSLYRSRAYDHQHPKPRINPIYKLVGITIGTAGNVITITAQQEPVVQAPLAGIVHPLHERTIRPFTAQPNAVRPLGQHIKEQIFPGPALRGGRPDQRDNKRLKGTIFFGFVSITWLIIG